MRDLFDEFMDELRRRQAALEKGESGDAGDRPPAGEEGPEGSAGNEPPLPTSSADGEPTGEPGQAAGPVPSTGEQRPQAEEEEPPSAGAEAPVREPTPVRRRGGGGGRRRPPGLGAPGAPAPNFRPLVLLFVLVVGVLVVFSLAGVGLDLWTDAIWYQSVGFASVFWTRIGAQVGLFAVGLVVALAVLLLNLWLAGRLAPAGAGGGGGGGRLAEILDRLSSPPGAGPRPRVLRADRYDPRGGLDEPPFRRGAFRAWAGAGGPSVVDELPPLPDLMPLGRWILIGVALLAALTLAGAVGSSWETILLWQHQVPFDPTTTVTDPIFGKDIGFFLFQLPFLRLIQGFFNNLVLAAVIVAGGRYVLAALRGDLVLNSGVRLHLAVLAGLYLLSVAAGYQLDKLELVYGNNGALASGVGVVTGVSYTDFHARFLALDAMTVIAALAAALLVGGAFTRLTWPLGLIVVAWFAASFILGDVYPSLVQRLTVDPNQQAQEAPFILNNIRMTRLAYGLNTWDDSHPYSGTGTLTQAAIAQDAATFQNARLWDYRPLAQTFDQLQVVRQYYQFDDVDTDRYVINGVTRQVMLSARELAPDQLAAAAGGQLSWVNEHLTYTHGIGLAMVPVNEVTTEGQPDFFIRDLPPVSSSGAPKVTEPRIYFGELANTYVVVDSRQPEFDYPTATGSAPGGVGAGTTTSWQGTTGIKLDSTLTRLLFALRFRDLNLMISDQVTSDSQLLFHRTLQDRLTRIAPFLRYDKDPYLVVTSAGRLVYIQDAYTISDSFPNAEAFNGSQLTSGSGLAGDTFDYIRNSVKVVMDAYTGAMTFYVNDPSDPIIRAYEGVFPSLFKPLSQMPADLQAHLRYPEELFNVQTDQYAAYHVTDPAVFYVGNDLWAVPPNPLPGSTQLPLEAYYVEMRMPGEANAEFLLLQPMIPQGRPNMIAWVAARNDGAVRGQVRVYKFPSDTTVLGPAQIEARIDQDPTISAQFTLWGQIGSSVIRGNLIVVPVQNSLVYLEPIYLQSTTTKLPEFKKIIVASPTTVVWGDTLAQALNLLLAAGGSASPSPPPSGSPAPSVAPSPSGPVTTPQPGNVQQLIASANQHFELAQQALRAGDFARYGQEMAIVQSTLQQLQGLVGTPAPSAAGSAAPSASTAP